MDGWTLRLDPLTKLYNHKLLANENICLRVEPGDGTLAGWAVTGWVVGRRH